MTAPHRLPAGAGGPDPAPAGAQRIRASGSTLLFTDREGRSFTVAPDWDDLPYGVLLAGHRLDEHTARLVAIALADMARAVLHP